MRNVIFAMMVSLDGFIEGPNHQLDWITVDEELHTFINDEQRTIDTYLYGRRLYEVMAGYWPTADTNPSAPAFEVEFARIWKDMRKIVFSATIERVESNARLAGGDIGEEIKALQAQPGKDIAIGGPTLASAAMRLGLIDEVRLYLQPIILGSGTPMFPALADPMHLRLVETHTFRSGVVRLRYARTG